MFNGWNVWLLAGKIAAEIAHEIKNPLAAMSGSMQMLQRETCDEPDLAKTHRDCQSRNRTHQFPGNGFLVVGQKSPKG